MNSALIFLIALLPAVALMVFIYFQDAHEREPIGLLLLIFLLGILSSIPVMLLEYVSKLLIDLIFGGINSILYYLVYAILGVGIIEEGAKFIAARILTWHNKSFNYKFDGIVYCLFASMGFAGIENVLYLFTESSKSVLSLGIQRGILAIPAHAMCAIFMGYYYGNAKYLKSYGDRAGCRRNLIKGFIIAVSLHSFYDFCLFTQNIIFWILFIIFVITADIMTIIRIITAKKEDQKVYEAPQYRQYWVGPAANPYEAYGGYQAPAYGSYQYTPQPVSSQSYTPQPISENAYSAQPTAGSSYTPQPVATATYTPLPAPAYNTQSEGTGTYTPQPNNVQMTYNNQTSDSYNPQPVDPRTIDQMKRRRPLHCPVCGTINSFYAFYCTSCGASLHQLH